MRLRYPKYKEFLHAMETRHVRYNETIDFLEEQEKEEKVFILSLIHILSEYTKDSFTDEIAVALDTEQGIVVIVGCSHPGIMNCLLYTSLRSDYRRESRCAQVY